jgi:hypothetical protein
MSDRNGRWGWTDRAGAACGAAYVLLICVGNQITMGAGGGSAHPTGADDLGDFARTPTTIERLGFGMEVIGLLTFFFFLGWFVPFLRSRAGRAPWLASVAGFAGTATIAIKIGSMTPMLAGGLDRASLTPGLARVLTDLNGCAFVVTFLTTGVFLLATGLAVLSGGMLSRFAGWTAVLFGAGGIVLTVATGIDPVSTNALPFMLGLLWILVVGVRLAVRVPRVRRTDELAEPGLEPATVV